MKSVHFVLEELVPPTVFNALGESAWDLFDEKLILTIDQLYEFFGPIVINDWHKGGNFKESGFRDMDSKVGAAKSRHKFGQALDCKPVKTTPQAMHAAILANPTKWPHLTTLEDIEATTTAPGKGWVHISVQPAIQSGIRIIKP